jgi:hypothetical protein
MFKSTLSFCVGGAIALVVALTESAAHADTIHYRYVAINQVPLPAPYTSFSPSIVIDGRVFGTVFDSSFAIQNVAVYGNGTITVGPAGSASVANHAGVIGGADPSGQAALFDGNRTTLIPRLPGFAFEHVVGLTDRNLALVQSTNNAFFGSTYSYFRAGRETVINFGLTDPVINAFMDDDGVIGLTKEASDADPFRRGYRYDPRTAKSTLLPPFAGDRTDVMVLVQGINSRGEVLGYSFTNNVSPGAYHERVGVWNTAGVFQPYFLETIQTSALVFNDFNQIVITSSPSSPSSDDTQCFLVPKPGTRLDLAPLVRNVPAGLSITQAISIDNLGNIAGIARDANSNAYPFVLQPVAGRR